MTRVDVLLTVTFSLAGLGSWWSVGAQQTDSVSISVAIAIAGGLLLPVAGALTVMWRQHLQGDGRLVAALGDRIKAQDTRITSYEALVAKQDGREVELFRGALAANTAASESLGAAVRGLQETMATGRTQGMQEHREMVSQLRMLVAHQSAEHSREVRRQKRGAAES